MIAEEYFSATRDTVENRAEILRDFGTIDPNVTQLYNADSDRVVRVYDDAAVVVAIGRTSGRDNKTGVESRYISRYLETWIRRNGKWQVVAGAYEDLPLPRATLRQELLRAEEDFSDMLEKRDPLAFQRLVADSVTFASGTDSVESKPQLWREIKESDVRTNAIHVDRGYVSGTGVVGVVNGTIDRTLKDGSVVHLRYANTWVYRGAWILLARQLVPPTTNTRIEKSMLGAKHDRVGEYNNRHYEHRCDATILPSARSAGAAASRSTPPAPHFFEAPRGSH